MRYLIVIGLLGLVAACSQSQGEVTRKEIKPKFVTDPVAFDSDDPAIWIHPNDLTKSLILGTDKGDDGQGGVFVFDLDGKEKSELRVSGIHRPNNVDVEYGLKMDSIKSTDIAVFTERGKQSIRVYSLPEMKPIDGGGIPVFEDSENRAVMGVALYKPVDADSIYAIVSRKGDNAPLNDYLYQYLLTVENDTVKGNLVRKFGQFSGGDGEIEAIAIDDQLGYIYYSDELFGIRKYYADPKMGNEELAQFGLSDFKEDREGISIYSSSDSTGYLLISDQQAFTFNVYRREGSMDNPHQHELIGVLPVQARESDGSDVSSLAYNNNFPNGFFVAMSDNRTFEIYDWRDLEAELATKE